MSTPELSRAVAAIWRIESAKLIAMLTRTVRSLDLAEEIAQEAFVEALDRWERDGIPDNPGAWLMTAARHRAIDGLRRTRRIERTHGALAHELPTHVRPTADEYVGMIRDDLLRLVFIACHPALPREARVALTLRLLGGLTTDEIARAFLVPEPTIAQRITRAKRTLAEKKVPFELPSADDLSARLESVLEVIYLVFNEGYAATAGDDWMRPDLCDDALRLGRILVDLVPLQPDVHGLVGLMEIQASRTRARTGLHGEPVLLLEQDRAKWDHLLAQRGLDGLAHAERLVAEEAAPLGPYVLQAAIAACHARATAAPQTDWPRIARLYEALAVIAPSPIVELNRGVAVAMAFGAAEGLCVVDRLVDHPALREYASLPSVRADLLSTLGRFDEAIAEIERAVALTKNKRERSLFVARGAAYRRGECKGS